MTADLFTRDMPRTDRPADTRTVLVGMNNPLSPHPRYALYPSPVNCTGWRVWRMIADVEPGITAEDYARGFDRRNVLSSREWSARDATVAGRTLMDALQGRRLVVLGVQTLRALGLPRLGTWGDWHQNYDTSYTLIPHPSGRCREYNSQEMREYIGGMLLREYHG